MSEDSRYLSTHLLFHPESSKEQKLNPQASVLYVCLCEWRFVSDRRSLLVSILLRLCILLGSHRVPRRRVTKLSFKVVPAGGRHRRGTTDDLPHGGRTASQSREARNPEVSPPPPPRSFHAFHSTHIKV